MNYSPRFAGAVPLDALAASRPPTTNGPASGSGSGPASAEAANAAVVDVTEASFQREVIERSMSVPVVIDFWAAWCGPCKQLSPILERLAAEGGGAWVLAKVDVDANQRLAAAAGVQGIPAVKAVWQGGIVGEFTGAQPEPQVRDWINQLISATGGAAADGEPAEPALDPAIVEAEAAFERGDYDAAEQAYQAVLAHAPADPIASAGLAGVRLYRRAEHLDPDAVRKAADAAPDDVDAQTAAADVELLLGNPAAAFERLVALVTRTSGADRDKTRLHLLSLFEAAGSDTPEVAAARAALSRALF